MKIGVLYNCQAEGIALSLAALLPGTEVVHYTVASMPRTEQARQEVAEVLRACDHVVAARLSPEHGPLATNALRRTVRRLQVMPALRFRAFHPDSMYVRWPDGKFVGGPTGDYQSRIGVIGYLAGLSVEETTSFYNRMVFQRLGYLAGFAPECALFSEILTSHGMDAATLLPQWLAQGCFMHSMNHPKITVLFEVARAACAQMGLGPVNPAASAADVPDRLATMPIHPVFPAIAKNAGVPPEGTFRAGLRADRPASLSLEEFLAASFAEYAGVPRELLLASDGVVEGLATLGLKEGRK